MPNRTPAQVEDALLEDEVREDNQALAPLLAARQGLKEQLDNLDSGIAAIRKRLSEARNVAKSDHITIDGKVN